jgi:hypothetical protein
MMMRKVLTAGLSDRYHHHHITKPEVGNPRHNNNKSVLLFLVITTALLPTTLSVPTIIMINAQGSSGDNNKGSSGTDKQQMGICVVGAGGPCNGDNKSVKTSIPPPSFMRLLLK